jgi:hypothetical protein
MNEILRLLRWMGSPASVSADANFSPLVSPIDGSVTSHMIESDGGVIDTADKHAHQAYLANHDVTTARRISVARALNLQSSIVI